MTKRQSEELLAAAIRWQEQGSRSKWKSETSLELWDLIEKIKSRPEEPTPVDTFSVTTEALLHQLAARAWRFLFSKLAWPDYVV
jgi:hypothetical protein